MTQTDDTAQAVRRRPEWLTPGSAALAVSILALGAALFPYVSGGDFGGRVRTYLLANPQVLDEVLAARQSAEDSQRVETVNAAIAANPALLATDPRDPAIGPVNASVVVHEFFDYRCPGCKAVAADTLRLVQANPDVRFVFKEWPILDRGEDVTSQYAARAALAAQAQGRYLAVHQALMSEASLDAAAVDRILRDNGVDPTTAQAAIADPQTTRHIADIHTAAATLGLVGTPTFIVNGRATAGIAPQDLAVAIEEARGS